ncbi:MAG: (deoxy)nucleoside triphosphate pyrophosphohydrolase [Algoriphagus sp.]|jgi:8-oxo-dGTP diphosphatase|uniref:(deoxy)nucleoside triphosphate pyrophosphohydrolase n=1 Tax=Algoriphagus sp. TaxID=1872435 RepID=UPI002755E945|nr:(deoxy)nucleoside triphosphate pyrophosphohydrolase [Algoriphagus sp.]MDP4748781.1 (deoxy)nucleoside triphosphate pyrophosphohydrolase [Algoriphagus sp.]MDP4839214.1 (deoxy)nucleoside triphosphate pyrophosphohydrolase [Algoriphagus sp.]MDP4904739.1 (deoxy)nucleoside triphosphate pyrophosphohydrolase [Algoriphagus sp.]MDP4956414.1 (deoxy)nucleoside triphosphate pyrophosphohydrolase [Algoriphagus sp.]
MNPIQVTCLLLFHQGKILATQRGAAMDLAGYWEFPGGKVEVGESPENSLIREINEELSIDIRICAALTPVLHAYPSKLIQLIPFLGTWQGGSLKLTEHAQSQWLGKEDLLSLTWAPADLPIVQEVQFKWEDLQGLT